MHDVPVAKMRLLLGCHALESVSDPRPVLVPYRGDAVIRLLRHSDRRIGHEPLGAGLITGAGLAMWVPRVSPCDQTGSIQVRSGPPVPAARKLCHDAGQVGRQMLGGEMRYVWMVMA